MELCEETKRKVDITKQTLVLGPYSFCAEYNLRSTDIKVTNCVAYTRVSTTRQRRDNTLQNQLDRIIAHCTGSLNLVCICVDDGLPGRDFTTRPGLLHLEKILKKGDRIVIRDLDRLTRDRDEYAFLEALCKRREVSLESLDQGLILGGPVGQMSLDEMKSIRQDLRLGAYLLTYSEERADVASIYGYCRPCSDAEPDVSIQDQIKQIESKCVEYNTKGVPINLVAIYVDEEFLGVQYTDRPALRRLLEYLKKSPSSKYCGTGLTRRIMVVDNYRLCETGYSASQFYYELIDKHHTGVEDLSYRHPWKSSFHIFDGGVSQAMRDFVDTRRAIRDDRIKTGYTSSDELKLRSQLEETNRQLVELDNFLQVIRDDLKLFQNGELECIKSGQSIYSSLNSTSWTVVKRSAADCRELQRQAKDKLETTQLEFDKLYLEARQRKEQYDKYREE